MVHSGLSATSPQVRQLFGSRPGAPTAEGPELALDNTPLDLDLPADSDTRLLGGAPVLVTAGRDGLIARDADTGEQRWHYRPSLSGPFTWAASGDGKFVAVRQKNDVQVVDAARGEAVRDLSLPERAEYSVDPVNGTRSIRFGPDHTVMADFKSTGREGSRSWAEYNLAFFDVASGQGPEVVQIGSVGFMSMAPVVSPSGDSLYLDDSYGLKSVNVAENRQQWQRHDLRSVKGVRFGPEGQVAVLHSGGFDVLDAASGKSTFHLNGWHADDLQTQDGRVFLRDWRNESMKAVDFTGNEQWKLQLGKGVTFQQVFTTRDLIYASASSEEEGHQVRLLLIEPSTGDVLAQSQPLGHLKHGLPMFQAENKVYLALEGGAIAFSPADIKVDELRKRAGSAEAPARIEIGSDFVQVGGVRLKSRRS